MKGASLTRRRRQEGGQALIEYVLLIALMSGIAFGYLKFYGREVLGEGILILKGKVGACLSHDSGNGAACQ